MTVYQAQLNQTILIATDGNHTVHAPGSPSNGHWFAVKITYIRSGAINSTTVDSLVGHTIEDPDGGGQVAQTAIGLHLEYARWRFYGGAWYREHARPVSTPGLFNYSGAALLLGTNTPIPLAYDDQFGAINRYFSINAGALECVMPFSGFMESRIYFEFVLPGNNQDAGGAAELYAVAGAPVISQGNGAGQSFAGPRSGTFYATGYNKATLVASVGDIIGLRGSDDPLQAGDTSIIDGTGLIVTAI